MQVAELEFSALVGKAVARGIINYLASIVMG